MRLHFGGAYIVRLLAVLGCSLVALAFTAVPSASAYWSGLTPLEQHSLVDTFTKPTGWVPFHGPAEVGAERILERIRFPLEVEGPRVSQEFTEAYLESDLTVAPQPVLTGTETSFDWGTGLLDLAAPEDVAIAVDPAVAAAAAVLSLGGVFYEEIIGPTTTAHLVAVEAVGVLNHVMGEYSRAGECEALSKMSSIPAASDEVWERSLGETCADSHLGEPYEKTQAVTIEGKHIPTYGLEVEYSESRKKLEWLTSPKPGKTLEAAPGLGGWWTPNAVTLEGFGTFTQETSTDRELKFQGAPKTENPETGYTNKLSFRSPHPSLATVEAGLQKVLDTPASTDIRTEAGNAFTSLEGEGWLEGEVPECRLLKLASCESALLGQGFETFTHHTVPWESIDLTVPANDVVETAPKRGLVEPLTTPVEIEVNPSEYVELPAPEEGAQVLTYQKGLEELGFTKIETWIATETEVESETEPEKLRKRVVIVIPKPGKTTEIGGTPGAAPEYGTTVRIVANPHTEGGREVETHEAVPEGGGGSGKFPKLTAISIGGITLPRLKFPEVAVLCTNFPFGVPCWIIEELERWTATGSTPTLGWSSFEIAGHKIPSASVSLAPLEPIMVKARPFMILFGTIGLVLFFYKVATGVSASGGGVSGPGESFEDNEARYGGSNVT